MSLIHPVPHITHVLSQTYLGTLQAIVDGWVDETDGQSDAVVIPKSEITIHVNVTEIH